MPISLDRLRTEVLEHLGIEATDLDPEGGSTVLDLLINRTFWHLCDELDFRVKDGTATATTVDGTREYDLPAEISDFEALQEVSLTDSNDQHQPLIKKEWHWYEGEYNEGTDYHAQPQYFIRQGKYLYLHPTPDDAYTLNLRYQKGLEDLTVTTIVPQNWHEALLYGAIHRGFLRQHDYTSAYAIKKEYEFKVGKLKAKSVAAVEDSVNRMAGVQVYGREY